MCVLATGTAPGGNPRTMTMMTVMKTLRFGIEIETVGLDRTRLIGAIRNVVGGAISANHDSYSVTDARGRAWRVVHDGSLSDSLNSGEIVSPILGYDDIELLQNIVRAVREAGAKADQSCGVHCHIDGGRFDVKNVVNLIKL